MSDHRRESPSVARNTAPILHALRAILPSVGTLLEIASGSGEHALAIAQAFPAITIQPSDPDAGARASIDAWAAGIPNIRPALALDAARPWPLVRADAILCINMIHIAPWAATLGLLAGAANALPASAPLILYGPFRVAGAMANGNLAFDKDLRARDPAWGIRDLEAVTAAAAGFAPPVITAMPANNLTVTFRRL
jgi:hypothetical protein